MGEKKLKPDFLIVLCQEHLDPFGDAEGIGAKAFEFFQRLGLLDESMIDLSGYEPGLLNPRGPAHLTPALTETELTSKAQ